MSTYRIVRFYQKHENETIVEGLTLDEAQAHCNNPESSSRTCSSRFGMERTKTYGPWFDGYTEEDE
jgi:hypothetical protein